MSDCSLRRAAAPWLISLFGAALLGCTAKADERPSEPQPVLSAQPPAIRVRVAPVRPRTLSVQASASGKLHAFKSATVAAEVAGRVTTRSVERGEAVQRRASLFKIDTKNSQLVLRQARANATVSSIDLELAERELARGDMLLSGQDISRSSHDQLRHSRDSAKTRLELAEISQSQAAKSVADARVRAPFPGTVVRIHAEVGDYVGPGTPLATVADLSKMRLRVGVTASEADALEAFEANGTTVSFAALGGLRLDAVLHDVDPLVDPISGTYTAEFWLDQPDGRPLREGMVGRIDLGTGSAGPTLAVPRQSVVRQGGGFAVWIVEDAVGDRRLARLRAVTLGRSDATHTEVNSGLASGDTVVTVGHFALAEGIDVEVDGEGV